MESIAKKADLLAALGRYGVSTASATPTGHCFHPAAAAFDSLLNGAGLSFSAVHELLGDAGGASPRTTAHIFLAAIQTPNRGLLVWSDPQSELTPQAIRTLDLRRLMLLRPKNPVDEIAMLTECLRSRAVAAVVAEIRQLSPLQARRLQLAAEQGGGAGILLRPNDRRATHYAAATRWLIEPAPGSDQFQRWNVTLVHGHGGRVGSTELLEVDRETGSVHSSAAIPNQLISAPPSPTRAIA